MQKSDVRVALKIVSVEGEQVSDSVRLHRRNKASVVYLFAFDVVGFHQRQPVRQDAR